MKIKLGELKDIVREVAGANKPELVGRQTVFRIGKSYSDVNGNVVTVKDFTLSTSLKREPYVMIQYEYKTTVGETGEEKVSVENFLRTMFDED